MKKYYFMVPGLLFLTCMVSCKQENTLSVPDETTLEHQCVQRLTEVIVYDIFSPPVAGRIYAYSNLAYYEAIRFADMNGFSLVAKMKGFGSVPVPDDKLKYQFSVAAVKAFFKVARALTFSKDSLVTTEKKILQKFENALEPAVYNNSIEFGDKIADVILKRAAEDNYKITRGMPKYSVFKETGKWQQTPPDYADAIEPNWRLIRPLVLDSSAQYKPAPPPPYSLSKNGQYYKELMEVYNVSKSVTPVQDTIAHYWDDNPFVTEHTGHLMFATKKTTPGGHWMGIVSIISTQTKADALLTAKAYAVTATAIFDGFISCWDEKYRSRMVRPVTVIRENIDPNWNALLQTPPFPEYTSGHSVITAAAATVLENIFGANISFLDTTELIYLGMQRSFLSIKAAADEAGISRLYGGIHYRAAIEEGKKQGQQVGQLVNARLQK